MDLRSYLKTHKKTHLIFDLDETLVHLILPWDIVLDDTTQDLEKIDSNLYNQTPKEGYYLSSLENAFVEKHGQKLKELFKQNRTKFETENLKEIVPNPELIDFIKKTKGYFFYVWSSNYTAKDILRKINISNKIKKIISANEVRLLKPEPEGFYKIYDPEISKENYLLVGDNLSDKLAAEKAGIDFYLEEYFK